MHPGASAKICIVLALALGACAPLPQRTEGGIAWQPSPNFDARRPAFVILHYTSNDTAQRALRTLTAAESRVSAHYLIARDGKTYQLVDELARAWHAGESYWGGSRDINSASLGIELDNNGNEPFAEPQIDSLLALLADLKERYSIPAENFLGHSDVAPRRKVDPGRYFPWRRLATRGFGVWCDAPGALPPPDTDDAILLNALGYDVSDVSAATGAFKAHYAPGGAAGGALTEDDRRIAYCLLRQKVQALAP